MPKRDLYRILGLSTQAAPGEIKRAYRRIAFNVHPDVGRRPDPERFREVHEAYEILSDPDRRRSYDVEICTRRRPLKAEPLRSQPPVCILDDFLTVRPSIEVLLDQIGQNFFGYREKRGVQLRHLGMEAVLDTEEARFGCRLPFRVPCYVRCRTCAGTGERWGLWTDCCGRGIIQSTGELALEFSPGTRDGERFELDLESLGITNALLEVRVSVV